MAKDFLVNIDLNNNQLLQVVVEALGSDPGSPGSQGRTYFHTGNDRLRTYNGATWDEYLTSTDGFLITDNDYGDITVSASGATWTIDALTISTGKLIDDAVTYAKIQNVVANNVFLGNNAGAGGIVDELTGTEATAMLDLFATGTTVQGLVPGSNGGGASVYLDGTGAWSSPGGGFADFDAGGDSGADVTVNSGDLYDVTGDTGITTTVSKASTTVTLSVDLDDTAVTPASYGLAGSVGQFTVDQQGRITTAADVAISITESQISDLGTAVTLNADTTLVGNGWFLDDDTMAGNDATKVVSQQSLIAYVAAEIATAVVGGMTYIGGYNASTDTPALDTGSPSITQGDVYIVTTAGTFFSTTVEAGDMLLANVTSVDAASASDWDIVQADLQQATEGTAGFAAIATQAEVTTGTDDTKFVTPLKLETHLDVTTAVDATLYESYYRYYSELIGDTSSTNFVITHGIGRQFVTAQVFRNASPYDQIECDIEMDTTTATSFTFNVAPSTDEFIVVISG
jgi:hypothetical protein